MTVSSTANWPRVVSLPYREDVTVYFSALIDRYADQWPVWLDSGRPAFTQGRYDILAAAPYLRLLTRGKETEIIDEAGSVRITQDDPLASLKDLMGPVVRQGDLPFIGGAIGYLGYDLSRHFLPLKIKSDPGLFPDMAIGIYDWAIVVDHEQGSASLIGQGRSEWLHQQPGQSRQWDVLVDYFRNTIESADQQDDPLAIQGGGLTCNMSQEGYQDSFNKIQGYIREGDCYQVNFAQCFKSTFQNRPSDIYLASRRQNPSPYGAYLGYSFGSVISASPEQFLSVDGHQVRTRPIKGTRPRSTNPVEDLALLDSLARSKKDRAENLMIVDLLRNDLGRVCDPGSIHVPELFRIESFATVHHLVSTVEGRLRSGEDAFSLLKACLPGGSVTGAPKIRAMQVIEELEPHGREVYCGAIGYIGFDGRMDTNIAIRTLLVSDTGEGRYWAGGGIVADSEAAAEYQESLDKAVGFMRLAGEG